MLWNKIFIVLKTNIYHNANHAVEVNHNKNVDKLSAVALCNFKTLHID